MSWPLVALASIAEVVTGNTPSKADDSFFGGDIPFVTPGELDLGFVDNAKQTLTEKGAKVSRLIPANSVMVCCIGSLGKVGISSVPVVTNQQINSLVINQEVAYPLYVYYFCKTLKNTLNDMAPKTTVAIVNKTKFSALKIPLPPLETQKKIAAVLEKADQLRKDCLQMEQELNSLAQSVFIDMFGDPVTNPKGWETTSLSTIASIQLGKMLSSKSKQNVNPKKYLRNANIQWREIGTADLLEMDFNEKEIKKFQLQRGDLLVCEGGEIGRCAIWNEQVQDCYYQKALHRVRVNPQLVTPEYLQEYFFWMAKLGGLVNSTNEVTFKHLTAEKMNELKVPLAPIATQKDFSSIYTSIRRKLDINAEMMIETEASFNSVMQKAFKGELNL